MPNATINAQFWRGPFVASQSDATTTLERLRARRVELRAQARDASGDAANAVQQLEQAQRAYRDARAQHSALGGPTEEVAATKKALASAEKAAERTADHQREAQDALDYLEDEVLRVLDRNAPEIFGLLAQDAEHAERQAQQALDDVIRALAAWREVALRQDILASSVSDQRIRDRRPPTYDLAEIAKSLQGLKGRLEARKLAPPQGRAA